VTVKRSPERSSMPAYRIYWLDQDNHITEADCLIGEADDNVREAICAHLGTAAAVEVWHRARLVARATPGCPRTRRP